MKVKIFLTWVLVGVISISTPAYSSTTKVVKAQLDDISKNLIVFNGRSYSYQVDTKSSVLAVDESEPESLRFSQLNVGDYYYFELYSSKREAKSGDFNKVIFISKQYQGDDE